MPFVISVTQRALPVAWGETTKTALKFPFTSELNPNYKTVLSLKIHVSVCFFFTCHFDLLFAFSLFFFSSITGSVNGSKVKWWWWGEGWGGVGIACRKLAVGCHLLFHWLLFFLLLWENVGQKKLSNNSLGRGWGYSLWVYLAITIGLE